jgi:hypothetical protein
LGQNFRYPCFHKLRRAKTVVGGDGGRGTGREHKKKRKKDEGRRKRLPFLKFEI